MNNQLPKEKKLQFMVGEASLVDTCLKGYLPVPFSRIVEVFGMPDQREDGKVMFEWRIAFADGTVASIYDYKASNAYDSDGFTPEQMRTEFRDWHIGGKSQRAVDLVYLAMGIEKENERR